MPTEVLSRIARPLLTSELCCLRLTCRLIERKLFNEFAFEFFRKKQFMMASNSIQALAEIAKSRLGGYMRRVVIGTDQLASITTDEPVSIADLRRFCDAADEQKLMGRIGCIPAIQSALENLQNLEAIDIRDFDSMTRYRDGPHAQWTSYGSTELREIGYIVRGNREWTSAVFQNVLHGAAAAGVRPTSLEVMFRMSGSGLQDNCLFLPKPISPQMCSLLSGLTKLHLDLTAKQDNMRHVGFPNLCELLSHTPNITWLRLNCEMAHMSGLDPENRGWTELLSWLARKPPSATLTVAKYDKPPQFQLQKLDFGRAYVDVNQLLEIVKAHTSLRTLSLQRVSLTEANKGPMYSRLGSSAGTTIPRLLVKLLGELDNTTVQTLAVKAVDQLLPTEGVSYIRWQKGGGELSDSITLRSLPGRSTFKDAVDLIHVDAGTACESSKSLSTIMLTSRQRVRCIWQRQ